MYRIVSLSGASTALQKAGPIGECGVSRLAQSLCSEYYAAG